MASEHAYRIIILRDAEKNAFVARVPELDLEARAATRAEAVSEIEEALEQHVAGALEDKQPLPEPVDQATWSPELKLPIAPPLHRELAFHARMSRMTPEELATQLLSRAIGALDGGRSRRRPEGEGEAGDRERERDRDVDRGNERGDRDRGGGRGRRREGYRPELDDKANFLEYLRGLEKGGPPQGGGGGGRGRR